MKVLFLSNLYPPNKVGGYEELCWEVATRFVDLGHQVSVLTSAYGGKVAEWPGQEIHQALRLVVGKSIYDGFDGSPFRRDRLVAQNLSALEEALRRSAPDVIFCWNLFALGRRMFDHLGEIGAPVVVMLTDNWLASMINPAFVDDFFVRAVYGDRNETEFLVKPSGSHDLPANISAIFGAEFMRTFYQASGSSFVRSEVIHNGVNIPADAAVHVRKPLDARRPVRLLFAGRVVEIKGAHTAIEALAELRGRRPWIDWRLDLVGDATDQAYRKRLDELAAGRGCAGVVRFVGRVSPQALPQVFAEHDIFVFPSLWEPFSLTLIHALAAGVPTIASSVGGNPEIVREGETGLMFPKGDAVGLASAILRLVDNPALAAAVGELAAREARAFSTERMIAGMEAHLLDRGGSRCLTA